MPNVFRMRKRQANGPAIRAMRELLGLSVSALAPRCDVSQGYLSRVELGDKNPSPTVLRNIATALGVPLDAISHVIPGCANCEEVAA